MRVGLFVRAVLLAELSFPIAVASAQAPEADASAATTPPAARTTLADCVRRALAQNPSLRGAAAVRDEATAERRSARGRFGPVVRVEANVMRWDSPFAIPLPLSVPGVDVPPFPVRDATTAQVSATVIQPLTGLWTVYEGHRAQQLGEEAARHQQRATTHDIVLAVVDAYFQALEAERMSGLAQVQVESIEAHVERARRLQERELISPNDVLAAEVRLADARAQMLQARGGARLARANLAFQIGLPANEEVWPAAISLSDSRARATRARPDPDAAQQRPELAMARARVEQARAGVRVATSQMLPQVNALAGVQHVEGVYFQPQTAWFVGAQLTWNVWEWGSSYYAIDAARARARQAEAAEARAREALTLEATQAEIDGDTARAQLGVARAAVSQAERNLASVERRFEQQVSTSTDVLDAQALLHAARVREARSEYGVLRAEARLRRARGLDPIATPGGSR